MPPRPGRKRKRQLDDPLASDSQDEDFSDQVHHSPRKRMAGKGTVGKKTAAKGGRKTPATKGKRSKKNAYHSDDDDISLSGDALSVASDDEPITLGASGRPLRSSRKTQPINYGEDSEDAEESSSSQSSSGEGEEEVDEDVGEKGAKAPTKKPSMLVKIKIPIGLRREHKGRSAEPEPQNDDEVPTRRTTRATSATVQSRPTVGGKGPLKSATRARGGSAGPPAAGTGLARRSTRLGGSEEPALQLTNSGKHGEIVRQPGVDDVIPEEGESSLAETSSRGAAESGGIDEQASQAAEFAADRDEGVQGTDGEQDGISSQPRDEGLSNDNVPPEDGDGDDDDSDVQPSRRSGRKVNPVPSRRGSTASPKATRATGFAPDIKRTKRGRGRRGPGRTTRGASKKAGESSEEYQEEEGGDDSGDDSMSNRSSPSKLPRSGQTEIESGPEDESSEHTGRSRGHKGKRPMSISQSSRKRRATSSAEVSNSEHVEINQELEDLLPSPKRLRQQAKRAAALEGETAPERTLRRRTQNVDYRILRPENAQLIEEPNNSGNDEPRRRTAPGAQKSWFDTTGPFGGSVSFNPFGRGRPMNPTAQDDSDSSDDERPTRPGMYGGVVGAAGTIMTPSTATAGLLPPSAQIHNSDPLGGVPGSLGKMNKGKNVNADIDPLGAADSNVDFSNVGGLDVVIQNLKEMVQLPLTYPELFLAKKITPPRGVLFHGPPGTGKTLMARALAASCSTETRKVTFYMRKGADCLSKWVGEAERQLRLLFEEAKNNQPSIIFFDEIDGLAPVRSSKQDQIHASIVSTMLALMDGMDGRGQVVVIGATNRPDAVDPALRRPGRFDREFYFPLPAMTARKSIIDIHTRGWSPALPEALKDGLAFQTKGYGGADLRSLCTEAALNAVQRTYPQIYMTSDKLALDPDSIHVTARDFMLAMKKVVPSSQRSSSSGTDPLPSYIEPLLSGPLEQLKKCMEGILPERKRLTVLEEAMYEDDHDSDGGFSRENMIQDFDQARVFRPRMLIHGASGMGQQYLAGALLNYFEKLHVQAFDLATLVGDSTRSVETAIVQLFVEVKRHKPSVMFIPDVDTWYSSISGQGLITFKSLLRSIPANDPVLLLGVTNSEIEDVDPTLLQDLFGFSKRDRFRIPMPNDEARWKYFDRLIAYIQKAPNEFPPDPSTRRKRELPVLPVVPPPPPRAMTKEERKAQDAKDKQIKNWLKMRLFYAIDTVRSKLRRFKKPILDYEVIKHLFEEPDVASDLATQGPANNYQLLLPKDIHSPPKVLDTSTGKSFYNMDMDVIEERVSNGYYCSARQFLRDVEYIRDDWMELGHKEHRMRVNELLTHLEVIATDIEAVDPAMAAQCAELWSRERKKMEERAEKAERQKRAEEEARLEAQKARASLDRQTPSVERQLHAGSDKSQERPTPTNATGNDGDVSVNISASAVISTAYPPSNGIGRYTHMSSSLEVQASQVSQNDDFTNTGTSSRQGSPAALHSPPPSQHTQSSEHASAFQTAISSIPANSSRSLAVAAANEIPQMISQPGAALGIAPVTGLSAIMNYASTTTSGKRTSDGTAGLNSQPFSHPYSNSNGTPRPMNPPLFHNFGGISTGDSQLPDTQVVPSSSLDSGPSQTSTSAPHSQPSNASSQSHHHHLHNSNSHSNSNNHNDSTFSHPAPPFFALPPLQTTITCDSSLLANLHKRLVAGTARYTVEQLEQVNSACMSKVWEMRACWNRNEVMREVSDVFDEVDGDIRERTVGDGIGDGSFGSA